MYKYNYKVNKLKNKLINIFFENGDYWKQKIIWLIKQELIKWNPKKWFYRTSFWFINKLYWYIDIIDEDLLITKY